jgi:hypothetical protein
MSSGSAPAAASYGCSPAAAAEAHAAAAATTASPPARCPDGRHAAGPSDSAAYAPAAGRRHATREAAGQREGRMSVCERVWLFARSHGHKRTQQEQRRARPAQARLQHGQAAQHARRC